MKLEKKLVLLAEDNLDLQTAATNALEVAGFDVLTATFAQGTLDLLEMGVRPDCLIVDVSVPDLGTEEYLNAIVKALDGHLGALVLTSGRNDLNELSRRFGNCHFIAKPYDLDDLIDLTKLVAKEKKDTSFDLSSHT